MALSILDGNQTATTLSTILTSGAHIPAHTVVSLGSQAISDFRGAVSGSVVSISNFPATQPVSLASVPTHGVTLASTTVTVSSLPAISGTVTANVANLVFENSSPGFYGVPAMGLDNGDNYRILGLDEDGRLYVSAAGT